MALSFEVVAKCSTTKARASNLTLPHGLVKTPIFMPVGTQVRTFGRDLRLAQGTIKGLTLSQLSELDPPIILGNTYHLGHRPGPEVLEEMGGLHKFMGWNKNLLTDSGGFQMVSLLKLAEITEVWSRKE